METLYFLVPIALVIVVIALKVLFWAINNGQFDDLDSEGHRILFDEDKRTVKAVDQRIPDESVIHDAHKTHNNLENRPLEK